MRVRRVLLGACLGLAIALVASVTSSAAEGRWKSDDNGGCYFDASDSGPDQCDPTRGRWKDDGSGGCYFDSEDSGPDQCVPPGTEAVAITSAEWRAIATAAAARGQAFG
jgi:hypothetical protein